ncbi:A/G-specific adenine glycosylase [Rhodoferax lacus]|uniref:A/G-specific adenine glycosylase n=1 Tax=Rhodoferax lacus TaxID=2184758 RepID=UPI001F3B0997|nr:A/G-specific adenine glycosylase [Rhodoferax lacus]
MKSDKADFATRVVQWQQTQGRNDLPWQNTRDPYRVWLSEIMLQQTQVATVKDYFARFLDTFPDVAALAAGSQDAVLGLWSGLGYYSRARNLHRCAQQVVQVHGGAFPQDAETLSSLPGIGPSTAAAIASLCFSERVAILDANVKRVVTRVQGFDADVAVAANARALWAAASALLPTPAHAAKDMARYTQGMMDLGAMVCTPKKPLCNVCPVAGACAARKAGDPERYPVRSRKLKRSSQALWLLWAQSESGAVWLARRPIPGVWGGLYCLPLFDSEDALRQTLTPQAQQQLVCEPAFTHVLTHKDLHLHACRVPLKETTQLGEGRWVSALEWPGLGLPAPVRKLLERT